MIGTSLKRVRHEIQDRINELEHFLSEIDEVKLPDDEGPLLYSAVRTSLHSELKALNAVQEGLAKVNRME